MKVVLAGAFGNLGAEILKCLVREGHEVVAADLRETAVAGTEGKYTFVSIDATDPATLSSLCDGADAVITTMGLTGASTRFTSYDIDYKGNLNLLEEAKRAGEGVVVRTFSTHSSSGSSPSIRPASAVTIGASTSASRSARGTTTGERSG